MHSSESSEVSTRRCCKRYGANSQWSNMNTTARASPLVAASKVSTYPLLTGNTHQSRTRLRTTSRLTIIVRDPALQRLPPRKRCLRRICNNINESDTIQTRKLFKIDVSELVAVDIIDGEAKVCPVRVGFEDVAPVRRGPLAHCHV